MGTVADGALRTATLDVRGMRCAGCVSAVERQLNRDDGVMWATVNLIADVAVIEYRPDTVSPERLAENLTALGFPSRPRDATLFPASRRESADERRRERSRGARDLAIAALLLIFSLLGHLHAFGGLEIPGGMPWHWALATLALLFPGREILGDGWKGWRHGMPNMNTLVGLGATGAYLASCLALLFPGWGWECFFEEPVMLLGFILLGRTLEARARGRAGADLEALMALQPPVVHLVGDPSDRVGIPVAIEQVRVGDVVRVLPGERVPVDGEIIDGQTTLDESSLTGESLPTFKQVGDGVSAGTIVLSGAIAARVTGVGTDTALGRIVASVESALARKAPVQKLADAVAGYFAYGVMAIALSVFVFWSALAPWWFPGMWPETVPDGAGLAGSPPVLLGLKLAISVLVVACPCALGLATPTALLVGTSLGAARGILLKGGDVLETAYRADTIVFDKTGTLTAGHPEVTDRLSFSSLSPDEISLLAAVVESGTNHPLARAIVAAAPPGTVAGEDFQTAPGLGVSARVNGERVFLGSELWLEKNGVSLDEGEVRAVEALVGAGKTVVYLARSGRALGALACQDRLRPDAGETVRALRELGLEVQLLSGDRPEVVGALAAALGIERYRARVSPEEKAAIVTGLQEGEGKIVAMVGDGINDAPALARAALGIALGGGTDVAIETAGIVLTRDRLSDVVEALRLSRATFGKIRQNLFWALGYNVLAIPIAAGVLLPGSALVLAPALSGALMAFSSVLVVTNSLLLRRQFPGSGVERDRDEP